MAHSPKRIEAVSKGPLPHFMIERDCVSLSVNKRGDVQAGHGLEPFVILLGRAILVQMGA